MITVVVSEELDWKDNQEAMEYVLIHELAHALLEVEDEEKAGRIADEIVLERRGKGFEGGENMAEKKKEYTLHLYWKQVDDFAHKLEEADTVPEALRSWAKRFEKNARHCRELADEFDGEDIEAHAAVHHIEFYGDEEVLEEAAEKELLQVLAPIGQPEQPEPAGREENGA